jgi:hypothetical protein
MTLRHLVFLTLLLAAIASPARSQPVQLQPPSLSGAIYVLSPGRPNATAVPGYKAFVSVTSGTAWQGPAITDEYGRFSFYGLLSGTYLLRIYDPHGTRVWQEVVQVPGTVPRIVIAPPASH